MHINSSSAQIKANESGQGPCDSLVVSANSARSRIRSCSFHIKSYWVNSSFQTYAVSDQVAGWLHTNNKLLAMLLQSEEAPMLNLMTCCNYCMLHTQFSTESAGHAMASLIRNFNALGPCIIQQHLQVKSLALRNAPQFRHRQRPSASLSRAACRT